MLLLKSRGRGLYKMSEMPGMRKLSLLVRTAASKAVESARLCFARCVPPFSA